jgi:chromosome segregation ATPase
MNHIKDSANPNVDRVLIYAGDHGYYWRKGGCGYTTANDAGVFTRAEAYALAGHCGPEKLVELHDVPEDHLPTLKEQIQMIREYNEALRQERDTLRAEAARLTAEVAKDREWLGRALDKQAEYLRQCGQLVEERDTLRVEAARLRKALEEADRHLSSMGWTVNRVQSALSSTTTTAEWLAARDEQMKRLGAEEELRNLAAEWRKRGRERRMLAQELDARADEIKARRESAEATPGTEEARGEATDEA